MPQHCGMRRPASLVPEAALELFCADARQSQSGTSFSFGLKELKWMWMHQQGSKSCCGNLALQADASSPEVSGAELAALVGTLPDLGLSRTSSESTDVKARALRSSVALPQGCYGTCLLPPLPHSSLRMRWNPESARPAEASGLSCRTSSCGGDSPIGLLTFWPQFWGSEWLRRRIQELRDNIIYEPHHAETWPDHTSF